MSKVILSKKNTLNGYIITLCDKELYGKTIKNNNVELSIGEFYKGEEIDVDFLNKEYFEDAVSIHAIGQNSVRKLLDIGIINKDDIKYFNNIPIVLVFYV